MSSRRVVGATTSWDNLFSDQDTPAASDTEAESSSWDILAGPWTPPEHTDGASTAPEREPDVPHANSEAPDGADSSLHGSDTATVADEMGWMPSAHEAEAAISPAWFENAEPIDGDTGSWWEGLIDPPVGLTAMALHATTRNTFCPCSIICMPVRLQLSILIQSILLFSCMQSVQQLSQLHGRTILLC